MGEAPQPLPTIAVALLATKSFECLAERARRVHEERLEGDDRGTPW